MRKMFTIVLIISSFCLALTGCTKAELDSGGKKQIDIANDSAVDKHKADAIDELEQAGEPKDLGSFYIGPDISEEHKEFVYSGEPIHIPFKVEGLSESKSDFGLIIFVDGNPQPFKIQKKDGSTKNEDFMHKFSLNNNEVELFDIVFTPKAGKEGDRVGIVFATIFKPDFIPKSKDNPSYGNYHSIAATIPQTLHFKKEVLNNEERMFNELIEEDISKDVIDRYARYGSRTSMLDNTVINAVLPEGIDEELDNNIFTSENNKLKFRFRIMGGPDGLNYRTVIYINHKPIEIMDFSSIGTKVKKGKMYTAEFELDTSDYDQLSTIYAISNPIGEGYMSQVSFPIKTKSGLIVSQ